MIKEYLEVLDKETYLDELWWDTYEPNKENEISNQIANIKKIKDLFPMTLKTFISKIKYFEAMKENKNDLLNLEALLQICNEYDLNINQTINTKKPNIERIKNKIILKMDESFEEEIKPWNLTMVV